MDNIKRFGGNEGIDAILRQADGSLFIMFHAEETSAGSFKFKPTSIDIPLSSDWIDRVIDNLYPTSLEAIDVKRARVNGTLKTAWLRLDEDTGELTGVPVQLA